MPSIEDITKILNDIKESPTDDNKQKFNVLAEDLINKSQLDLCLDVLEKYRNIVGDDNSITIFEGVIAVAKKEYSIAKKLFLQALEYDENNIDVLFNLAWVCEIENYFIEAVLYYKRALKYCDSTSLKNEIENNLKKYEYLSSVSKAELELLSENYDYDILRNVFIKKGFVSQNCADGSEKFIFNCFDILRNKEENPQNDKAFQFITDSLSKYHLSPLRANIFESVKQFVQGKKRVLEISGELGALTEWLAKNCVNVDVVDVDINRLGINRLRNKFNTNVRFFGDNPQTMDLSKQSYDVITMIGAFEKIGIKSGLKSESSNFFKKVYHSLHDGGVAIIAMNNKLGAKYFSGCREDFSNKMFEGINDYPKGEQYSLSRVEIEKILKSVGFEHISFYGCFPDYKFPKTVFRDCQQLYNLNIASIVRGLFSDSLRKREHIICDSLFLETLTKAKLLGDFANSFLIVCSKSKRNDLKNNHLAIKFWNDLNMPKNFHHTIKFLDNNNKVEVKRELLNHGRKLQVCNNIEFNLKDDTFVQGQTLSIGAYKSILAENGYKTLVDILKEIRDLLITNYSCGNKKDRDGFVYIKPEAVDCCTNNIVRDIKTGELKFIDQKWKFKQEFCEDFVIYRSISGIFFEMMPYIIEEKLSQFVMAVMKKIYPKFTFERLIKCFELESVFQSCVCNRKVIVADIHIPKNIKSYSQKNEEVNNGDINSKSLNSSLLIKEKNLIRKEEELHLFIIWNSARKTEKMIINDLKSKFQIIDILEVCWDKEISVFTQNLSVLYGQNLKDNIYKQKECGNGPFLLIIVKDKTPYYDLRRTTKGFEMVNVNMFDAKVYYRNLTGGGYKIHATNLVVETYHDLAILMGLDAQKYFNNNLEDCYVNTKKTSLYKKNSAGVGGWSSLQELFYVLNLTNEYVVLRNFDILPYEYKSDLHGDIDLLTNDISDLVSITGAKKVFPQNFRVHYKINISGEDVFFDFRFVEDNYYDVVWQKDILRNRIFCEKGFYIPDDLNHFYSLVYHAVVHKMDIAPDYIEKFAELNKKFDSKVLSEFNLLKDILIKFMKSKGYKFCEPNDLTVYYNPRVVGIDSLSSNRKKIYGINP